MEFFEEHFEAAQWPVTENFELPSYDHFAEFGYAWEKNPNHREAPYIVVRVGRVIGHDRGRVLRENYDTQIRFRTEDERDLVMAGMRDALQEAISLADAFLMRKLGRKINLDLLSPDQKDRIEADLKALEQEKEALGLDIDVPKFRQVLTEEEGQRARVELAKAIYQNSDSERAIDRDLSDQEIFRDKPSRGDDWDLER